MNRRAPKSPGVLRIWQQNVRKSRSAQEVLINTANPQDWDVLAIQEPFLDDVANTRASPSWRVVYPPDHKRAGSTRVRSVLLVNTNIATDAYCTLNVPCQDVTAVRFNGEFGFLSLFNVYNDCTHNDSLTALSSFLSLSAHLARPSPNDHMVWLGDFNRHHPLWETVTNRHLDSPEELIRPLLKLLSDYEMDLSLPAGVYTYCSAAGNWSRPDNVWRSHHDVDPIVSCNVEPKLLPPIADHLPIVTVIELPIARSASAPSPNFHDVEWDKFEETLGDALTRHSPAVKINSKAEFDDKVDKLTTIIQETIRSHVPVKKPCPFSKRWWNREITLLVREKERLSKLAHKFQDIINHPSKAEFKKISQALVDKIKSSKMEHWINWLENIDARQIYTANKYVVNEPSDMSCARVPDLKTSVNGAPSIASTNEAKAAALAESFFPPPPSVSSVPPSHPYPTPLSGVKYFSHDRIRAAIGLLKPFKAPGGDGIPNVVLKKCVDTLLDHLYFIYRAVLELDVYHERWLISTTLVLRKIGKPAYDVAKAYRPIGLLDTIGKLLSALVAADLSYLAEKHGLLPKGQFGGRAGRNTTDAMHMVELLIKDAWRNGKVAVALFLDVQGAFPNTVKDQLLHNLRERRIPKVYVKLIDRMLTGRKTRLKFDDFISDLMDVLNGTTQGCPLSMILYAFYNAKLIEVAAQHFETSIGFVDDSMVLAIAKSLQEGHEIIRDMMERACGGFSWSTTHNSPFELSKLALMNYPRSYRDIIPPDLVLTRQNLDGTSTRQVVNTVSTYKYLGVVFDSGLRWTAHYQKVIASATWWSFQVARLSRISGGMPPSRIRQLYNTVAVPAFTYAADVWYTGIHQSPSGRKRLGSVAVTKKLIPVQRRAAKLVTGSLSTTAGDVLDAHANLLPVDLLFHKVLFRAAVRLASLPRSHPLHSPVRRTAARYVKRHRSSLHHLFHITGVIPSSVETVDPARRPPSYRPSFTTHIPKNKDEALARALSTHRSSPVSIYCDGSGFEGGIGASAVMYKDKVEVANLKYHLGPSTKHTVYEGELVGLTLALHLLKSLQSQLHRTTVIGSDSQAAIKALCNQKPHPAHYLLDHVHDAAEDLQSKQFKMRNRAKIRDAKRAGNVLLVPTRGVINLQVHWTPGHVGFSPNERADEIAKQAAQGSSSIADSLPRSLRSKPLPSSISALRQEHTSSLQKIWEKRWKKSPRYAQLSSIDKSLPSKKFLKLVGKLDRRQSAIIAQLRTGHSPLNQHLFRIRRSESPVCPHCLGVTVESVHHFLFVCPHYQHERHILRRRLKRKAESISFLLSNASAVEPLLSFIHATKRFKT